MRRALANRKPIMTQAAEENEAELVRSALLDSEARFEELSSNIGEVFYSREALTGRLLYISPACERLTGRSVQDFYARPQTYIETVHPSDRAAVLAAVEANLGGLPTEIDCRLVSPNGDVVWVRHKSHLAGDRVLGTLRDISAQKRADAELAKTSRALQLLSQGNRALARFDDERALLAEVCRLAVDIGGYRMAWVGYVKDDGALKIEPMAHAGAESGYLSQVQLSWAKAPSPNCGPAADAIRRREVCECNVAEAAAEGQFWASAALARGFANVLSLPLIHNDEVFGALAFYSADPQSATIKEIWLLQELADNLAFGIDNIRSRQWRQRVESAIFKVAAGVSVQGGGNFFDLLVRHMADAMGAQGAFVARLLPGEPLRARSIAGLALGEPVPSFDYRVSEAPCRELLNSPSLSLRAQVPLLYPQASALLALGTQAYVGHRLENSAGELAGMLMVVFDRPLIARQEPVMVSTLQIFAARASAELERLQADIEIRNLNASLEERVQQRTAQLKLANQELESFCYSVSHDLRSPLSAVDGFASLLEHSIDSLPAEMVGKSPQYLKRIRSGVVQMGELIEALLSLARLARAPLKHELVDLSALASEVLTSFQERDPARVLEADVAPGLSAMGDPRLMRQLLDNLLGNAWKFSAGQAITRIEFGTETGPGNELVYFVRDNGVGFNMAYAQKLFGPFQRLHSPSEFEGSGIGLATVQRIVVRHGGRVWGESSPGQGATFRFTLGEVDEAGDGSA
jgi:signal transduction histidine kinase